MQIASAEGARRRATIRHCDLRWRKRERASGLCRRDAGWETEVTGNAGPRPILPIDAAPYLGRVGGADPIPENVLWGCEPLRISFDPRPYLDELDVGRRRVVFLDLNFWLNLTDRPSPIWLEIENVLRAGVESGRMIVPVTSWNLIELSKLRNLDQGGTCIDLVCDLSRSVVFRDRASRIRDEVRFVLRNHRTPPGMNEMRWWFGLTIWPAMHGDVELVSHPSPLGREVLGTLGAEILDAMARSGLRTCEPEMLGKAAELAPHGDRWEESMAELRRDRPGRSVNFEAQIREEADGILLRLGESRLNLRSLGDELMARFVARYPTDGARIDFYVAHVPTLFVTAAVHAAYLESGKNYTRNDFFDIENLITAAPYAHVAAVDKTMRHIGAERLKLGERFPVRIVSTPESLLESLRALAAASGENGPEILCPA
jgi:hypothetical protein